MTSISLHDLEVRYRRWRVRTLITCWTFYASYYLCRQNFSIAMPKIRDEMGWSDIQLGWIATGLFVAYAIGQFINGLLGDRFGARKVGTIGMLLSALFNIGFGLSFALPVALGMWAANGFVQASGAPMRIKTMANWFSPGQRGKMMGLCGTDYLAGNVFCWLLAGYLVENVGWRSAFVVPAVIVAGSAILFYVRVRNAPENVGLPTIEEYDRIIAAQGARPLGDVQEMPSSWEGVARDDEHAGWGFVLKASIGNFRVWLVGLAYFGVDLIRYGFMVWAPTYLFDQGARISHAAYQLVMMPLIGALGVVISGWLTDRIGGRRAPVISAMLFALAVFAFLYRLIPPGAWVLSMICLGLIGFCLYGPHLLMGATIAMDLGSRKASSTASGLIDALGYAGAAVAGTGTAYVKQHFGWDAAFYMWIGGAVMAGLIMLALWNYRAGEDREYM
jgi:OPA family glycerol-3-phosphate transporter-like MFS transporter